MGRLLCLGRRRRKGVSFFCVLCQSFFVCAGAKRPILAFPHTHTRSENNKAAKWNRVPSVVYWLSRSLSLCHEESERGWKKRNCAVDSSYPWLFFCGTDVTCKHASNFFLEKEREKGVCDCWKLCNSRDAFIPVRLARFFLINVR